MPQISVLMSVFKPNLEFLDEAIQSILEQTFSDFEFSIANDGSKEPELKDKLQLWAKYDSRIQVIEQENIGLTKTLNKLDAISRGEFLARIDDNDISSKTRFEKQLKFMKENSEVGLCCANVVESIDEYGNRIYTKRRPKCFTRKDLIWNPPDHSSFFIRRTLFNRIGRYSEVFPFNQDYDLLVRMFNASVICSVPGVISYIRFRKEGISYNRYIEQIRTGWFIDRLYNQGEIIFSQDKYNKLMQEYQDNRKNIEQRFRSQIEVKIAQRKVLEGDWTKAYWHALRAIKIQPQNYLAWREGWMIPLRLIWGKIIKKGTLCSFP